MGYKDGFDATSIKTLIVFLFFFCIGKAAVRDEKAFRDCYYDKYQSRLLVGEHGCIFCFG